MLREIVYDSDAIPGENVSGVNKYEDIGYLDYSNAEIITNSEYSYFTEQNEIDTLDTVDCIVLGQPTSYYSLLEISYIKVLYFILE